MKIYGLELPEPISKNTSKAISIARKIHQNLVDKRVRDTEMNRWDKYWVLIYDLVLKQLQEKNR